MTTTAPAKVQKVLIDRVIHEAGTKVTRVTYYATLVMTDDTERVWCGGEGSTCKVESHRTIETAKKCGIAASQKIGFVARNGQEG